MAKLDLRTALPPRGSAVRDKERNLYGRVESREGRRCVVRYLDGSSRTVYVSMLEVIRRVRTVY